MIVDGVLNPVDWSTGHPGEQNLPFSSRLRSNVGAQDTLEEFFRLCDSAGAPACAFAPDSTLASSDSEAPPRQRTAADHRARGPER